MSEEWADIGDRNKPDKPLARIPMCPEPKYKHEPAENTMKRFARCMEAICRIAPEAKPDADGLVQIDIKGKKFDMFPSSDTWFSHAKNLYGTGIHDLVLQIEEHLLAEIPSNKN